MNNRSLKDSHMDDMDHALGRPNDPCGEVTRNFFGIEEDCETAKAMKANPHWHHLRDFLGTAGFAVSEEGKAALAVYLKEN